MAKRKVEGFRLRWMYPADLFDFYDGTADELTLGVRGCLEEVLGGSASRKTVALTAEAGGGPVGWAVMSPGESDWKMLGMEIHPNARRHGVGTAVMDRLKKRLNSKKSILRIVVTEGNLAAQLFLREQCFRWVNTTRSIAGWENKEGISAYLMEFRLSSYSLQNRISHLIKGGSFD